MVVVDTNLWIYFLTEQDPGKREVLQELLKELAKSRIIIPLQVFKEIAFVLKKKMKLDEDSVIEALNIIKKLSMVKSETILTVKMALRLTGEYKLQFWDSLIIAFSLENNIPLLLTEDTTYPEITFGEKSVRIVNPLV